MDVTFYYVLHVASAILLAAFAFQALGAPDPARRKRAGLLAGIAALAAVTGGFGLLAKIGYGFEIWVALKVVAWLVLAALAGLASRVPSLRNLLALAGVAAVLLAVYAVYVLRPGAL